MGQMNGKQIDYLEAIHQMREVRRMHHETEPMTPEELTTEIRNLSEAQTRIIRDLDTISKTILHLKDSISGIYETQSKFAREIDVCHPDLGKCAAAEKEQSKPKKPKCPFLNWFSGG